MYLLYFILDIFEAACTAKYNKKMYSLYFILDIIKAVRCPFVLRSTSLLSRVHHAKDQPLDPRTHAKIIQVSVFIKSPGS